MKRIDIDEPVPPVSVSLGYLCLRVALGLVIGAQGVVKLLALTADPPLSLERHMPEHITLIGIELAAGLLLIAGRFTRTMAFIALCDALAAAVSAWSLASVVRHWPQLESATLLTAAALFVFVAGSGRISADRVLRKRARIKSLLTEDLWPATSRSVAPQPRALQVGAQGRELAPIE